MSSVQEIEKAIQKLPREEIFRLHEVIQHRFDDAWDRQFADDVESGLLDEIAAGALAEHRIGKSTSLPRDEK
jgi:hypothetical protein